MCASTLGKFGIDCDVEFVAGYTAPSVDAGSLAASGLDKVRGFATCYSEGSVAGVHGCIRLEEGDCLAPYNLRRPASVHLVIGVGDEVPSAVRQVEFGSLRFGPGVSARPGMFVVQQTTGVAMHAGLVSRCSAIPQFSCESYAVFVDLRFAKLVANRARYASLSFLAGPLLFIEDKLSLFI